MSLIVVKEIGYGLKGDTLDITIAIPKGSYLKNFWVYNQIEAQKADCNDRHIGIDYIAAVKNTLEDASDRMAFLEMFTKLCESTDDVTGNIYDIYKIKPDFIWVVNPDLKGIGIKVSQKDLTFVTMELEAVVTSDFEYSTECGEDGLSLTVPLFNLLPLRLMVLNEVKELRDKCDAPRGFMDKLLQLKTIELAICCKDYCKAVLYWNKFFSKGPVEVKKCGCHGGNL